MRLRPKLETGISANTASGPRGVFPSQLLEAMGNVLPVAAAAAAALAVNAVRRQPMHAPGPTEQQRRRAEQASADFRTASAALPPSSVPSPVVESLRAQATEAEEAVRRAEEDARNYPVPSFLRAEHLAGAVNICVTGASGVGKSSLINALRRVKALDAAAAKVGEREQTMEPAK